MTLEFLQQKKNKSFYFFFLCNKLECENFWEFYSGKSENNLCDTMHYYFSCDDRMKVELCAVKGHDPWLLPCKSRRDCCSVLFFFLLSTTHSECCFSVVYKEERTCVFESDRKGIGILHTDRMSFIGKWCVVRVAGAVLGCVAYVLAGRASNKKRMG